MGRSLPRGYKAVAQLLRHLAMVDAMRMRDILSISFGDVSEGLARLVGLALRRDGVDIERVHTVPNGKPIYADADSMVVDVDRALRSKEVQLLPVLDGTSLLGLVDVAALPRFAARDPRMSAVQ